LFSVLSPFIFSIPSRFSQNFIDIREKERKRGARGLVSKTPEHLGNETAANDNATTVATTTTQSPEEQAKSDEMFKLQQKITQEILNSNLKEKEMNELQVTEQFMNNIAKLFRVLGNHFSSAISRCNFNFSSNIKY
jgi:hypothetical protein